MKEYDVIVAGAGPGGATAAYYLARRGLDVTLLDRDTFPRAKACGGGLCPHIRGLDNIDRHFFKVPTNSARIFGPSLTFIDHDPGMPLFYQVEREEFDHHLVKKAVDAGAHLMEGHTVKKLWKHRHTMQVTTDKGTLNSKAVVGATGVFGPVATYVRRKEGLPRRWRENELAFCLVTEIPMDPKEIERRYGKDHKVLLHFLDYVRGGYGWVFPKKDRINIGMGTFVREMKAHGSVRALDTYLDLLKSSGYLPEELPEFRVKGGLLPFRGPLSRPATHNTILVGDSAGFVSPISGEGIFFAMDSGRIAARSLAAALESGRLSSADLNNSYTKACMEAWGKELLVLRELHGLLVEHVDRSVRYAARDRKLREEFAQVMTFTRRPSELKTSLGLRMGLDLLRYDILRI